MTQRCIRDSYTDTVGEGKSGSAKAPTGMVRYAASTALARQTVTDGDANRLACDALFQLTTATRCESRFQIPPAYRLAGPYLGR